MKTEIHPTYYPTATIKCACGQTFKIGSTSEELRVELCSNCHPFYTGQQKLVDTARRVDKFQKRAEAKTAAAETRRGRRLKLAARNVKRQLKIDESKKVASKHKAGSV
jgi:large subunit ribosomal protein L31